MIRPTLRRLNEHAPDLFNSFVSRRKFDGYSKQKGPLEGTSYAAKANISTALEPTTCSSKILNNYVSPFDATVISQLDSAGSTLVGKANMDEFGMGSSTTFSSHGPTVNPRFEEKHIAGGSSGGSAAAVAAGYTDFSLGTDTGGSVRQPGSYCGIVGFKPSYGRISRYGVVPYAQGFDCVGILSKKVDLTRRVFSVLDQYDDKDITSMPQSTRDLIRERQQKTATDRKMRIGIPQEYLLTELDSKTIGVIETVLQGLMELGHSVYPVSIESVNKSLSPYYTLATAEAASNLSRYDGIRYGLHGDDFAASETSSTGESGNDRITRQRTEGLGVEAQRRVILGNYTLSSEAGADYFRATQHRKKLVKEFDQIFAHPNFLWGPNTTSDGTIDVLIGPTVFGTAPTFVEYGEQRKETFLNEYLNDVFTVPPSMAGLPAISVPCGDGDCGVQVIGQYGDDETVLQVAQILEGLD